MATTDVTEIRGDLLAFLRAEVLAPGVQLTEDDALAEAGVDSFSLMEVVLFAERRWGVVLPMQQLTPETVRSVDTLGEALAQLVAREG